MFRQAGDAVDQTYLEIVADRQRVVVDERGDTEYDSPPVASHQQVSLHLLQPSWQSVTVVLLTCTSTTARPPNQDIRLGSATAERKQRYTVRRSGNSGTSATRHNIATTRTRPKRWLCLDSRHLLRQEYSVTRYPRSCWSAPRSRSADRDEPKNIQPQSARCPPGHPDFISAFG